MTADQFVRDGPRHLLEVERAALARELAVEDDLQQQVAQFFGHLVVVASLDGIKQFIHFLHGVETKRLVILLAVPRAARGRAEFRHDGEQIVDGGAAHGEVQG